MSHNQSRGERSESTQYRRTGRSGNPNQQRYSQGGVSTKGGGGPASATSNVASRGSKKYNNNAQGGHSTARNPNVDSNSGINAVHNGSHQQQHTQRVYDAPLTGMSPSIKSTDAPSQNATQVDLKPSSNVSAATPISNVSAATSESGVTKTPEKDPSKPFTLQFGSISPSFINGVQVPARTTSAPPNLDEQKKAQARQDSFKGGPPFPVPSIPKQHLPKKDAGITDQTNAVQAQPPFSKSKRDTQVLPASSAPQTQKPSVHPTPGMPMPLPYHQPQVPIQFGGPNPQIQSQAMSGTSLPLQMQMPLPIGSPPMQQPMFIPGLQHPMHSQGMMPQVPNFNFSTPMAHQLPPQLGNMGVNIGTQFPQQQAGKFSGTRKTVKITHPETHEELRLDGSSGARLHPHVPPQSQHSPSFPPNHSVNFYPSGGTPIYHPATSTVPLNIAQVLPTSQPKFSNQATVKPSLGSRGGKEQCPTSNSTSTVKVESLEPSKLHCEGLVHPQKGPDSTTLSSLPQSKLGLATSSASSGSIKVHNDLSNNSTSAPGPIGGSESASMSIADGEGVVLSGTIEDNKSGNKDQQDQVGGQSTALSSLSSQPFESAQGVTEGKTDDKPGMESSIKPLSPESPAIVAKVEQQSDQVTSNIALSEHNEEKAKDSSAYDKTSSSDTLSAVGDNVNKKEATVMKSDLLEQEFVPISNSSSRDGPVKPEDADIDNGDGVFVSPSSNTSTKVPSDENVAKTAAPPRVKKKMKELYRKAEAAGTSSDLYMAYKTPEEKKETVTPAKSTEKTSSISTKDSHAESSQENHVSSKKPDESNLEPDDWEDAAEISPQLRTSKNENRVNAGNGTQLMTKKYSRDFLLKFVNHSELPKGFEITQDIADAFVVFNNNSREYPSPGRPVRGSRLDRRDGPLMAAGRGDMWQDVGFMGNVAGFRPNQAGNYGVLRNPRAQTPFQYGGGIIAGPMQTMGPDRWQRATNYQKGLIPSPQAPPPVMHKAEKKYEVGKVTDEEQAKQRQLKAILNKLTPQNFEKLFQQVKQVNIDNGTTLAGVIAQIFDKALMEPTFCEMYADFCFHLAAGLPDLSVENERITFKRLLLNKCQEEFERGEREEEEANKLDEEGEVKQTKEEREEKRLQVRRRMLGNIRLIGELYKKRMLTERIMHECINKLLGDYQNPDEENIEALCKLMSTIGAMIDHQKAKDHMDAYFDIMAQLSNNMNLSSRVRFMLKDAIDLRKNKWQQRRKVEGPKKIEEVHRDAAQERHAQASRLARTPSMGNSGRRGPPPMDYAPRAASILSSPGSHMGAFRAVPPQMRYGSHDARIDERKLFENRTSVPLPPRTVGDDSVTLGPQGGLVRGMGFRGQPHFPEIPSPGDSRRTAPGVNGFSSIPDRFDSPSGYDQYSNTEFRSMDSGLERSLPTPSARGGPLTSMHDITSEKGFSEEYLRDKSMAAIKEFYSARDEKEVAYCIKDLNSPSFYSSMISIWISDSFERKDMERDLLMKLLINLAKPQDGLISEDQLIKGFESVFTVLEDSVNDAPRAAEYLGRIIAGIVSQNLVSLSEIGPLIIEGGEEPGRLVETGLAAEVMGTILDVIKSEKGDSVLNEIRSGSNLRLEDFRPPVSSKGSRIDKYV